ncbi:unnamed protein product, partial [Adineta ricciae]
MLDPTSQQNPIGFLEMESHRNPTRKIQSKIRKIHVSDPRPSESNAIPSSGFHRIRRIPVGSDKILYCIRSNPISSTVTTSYDRTSEASKCFITRPACMSVELNAHNLPYLILLVQEKQLPKQALINIHLFSSQPCEAIFRDARSLSGTFSSTINFTVKDFIRRSKKLSILNQIKNNSLQKELSFPTHYKREHAQSLATSLSSLDAIDTLDIVQIISIAYDEAIDLVEHSQILEILEKSGLHGINSLSKHVSDVLKKNSRMIDYSSLLEHDFIEEFDLDEEDDDETNYAPDQVAGETQFTGLP